MHVCRGFVSIFKSPPHPGQGASTKHVQACAHAHTHAHVHTHAHARAHAHTHVHTVGHVDAADGAHVLVWLVWFRYGELYNDDVAMRTVRRRSPSPPHS